LLPGNSCDKRIAARIEFIDENGGGPVVKASQARS
jgi:hypothetical protein